MPKKCVVLIVVLLGLLTPFFMRAQSCASECVGSFINGSLTVEIDDSCLVTLAFQKRLCGGVFELNVLSAVTSGPCADIPAGERVRRALAFIVHHNLMNFPPFPMSSPGTVRWRISRKACWQPVAGDADSLEACSNQCCVNHLDVVKKEGCEDFQVTKEYVVNPLRACPLTTFDELENAWIESSCTDACGEFFPIPGGRQ